MARKVDILIPEDFPLVEPGDDLADLFLQNLRHNNLELLNNDVVVIAQKIISKTENRYVDLSEIQPGEQAKKLAQEADKDPRQMQVLLDESSEVVKVKPGVVIVEHKNGYVHANAGIDQSNIDLTGNQEKLLLLPEDPDISAEHFRKQIKAKISLDIFVIINDSFGRAWRNGTCGVCIGSSGMQVIEDKIGDHDLFGNELKVTQAAVADEIAAAASLVMGQADEGTPVVIIRGLSPSPSNCGSTALIRDRDSDLFR